MSPAILSDVAGQMKRRERENIFGEVDDSKRQEQSPIVCAMTNPRYGSCLILCC